jgi:hypothetical protein
MDRRNIESTMISSIGYDFSSSALEIEFKSGVVWQYYDFPESTWYEFDNAESQGKFFLSQIKGQYTEVKVG